MKLGLGTVQFGLDYGITNPQGQVPPDEVGEILRLAAQAGIDLLDTAAQYGESESVLGQAIPSGAPFRIVTKTPSFNTAAITSVQVEAMETTLAQSLQRLNHAAVYGWLLHQVDDLFSDGGDRLLDALYGARDNGQVEKIGVSVYTGAQIDRVLQIFTPDIVQLPINLLDQRLIHSGHLARLKSLGVEIHARSLFLQGVLLNPSEAPAWMGDALDAYAAWLARETIPPLQAALSFAAGLPEIDVALVGVCSRAQLREILDAFQRIGRYDFSRFACADERVVNPALWPR